MTYSDPTTRVSPPSSQRIRSPNNILVEKSSRPDLTWHERRTQDTDEEAQHNDARGRSHRAGQCSGDRTSQQAADENISRSELIAKWTGEQADDQSASESHDVGIRVFILAHVQILANRERQEWRKGIPASG